MKSFIVGWVWIFFFGLSAGSGKSFNYATIDYLDYVVKVSYGICSF